MEDFKRRADDGQKISFTSKLSQVFFDMDGRYCSHYQMFRRGEEGSNRRLLLGLGLLNVALLIAAVGLGISCAKVREGSIHVSHSSAKQLIDELDHLRSNQSDVIKAEEDAKKAFETKLKQHEELKEKIKQQRTINANNLTHIMQLQTELNALQSNLLALEGTCGRCPAGWILHNSSCYFFSPFDSSNEHKNWQDSREDCITRGADLTVIDDQEEQIFVSNSIRNMETTHHELWIGLYDPKSDKNWVWVNNASEVEEKYWKDTDYYSYDYDFRYHHFYGHDRIFTPSSKDCAVTFFAYGNPWKTRYAEKCNAQRPWICEKTST